MQQRTLGRQGLTVSAIGYGAMGTAVAHPSLEERQAKGREARDRVPLSSHAGWRPAADRPDPSRCCRSRI